MIRLAQKSDLDRVLQITRLCAREMESRKVFQWNEHYPDRQSFVNDINNSELYVYCIQDMVIGCVSICAFMDEVYSKVSWKTDGKNSVYVHRLAVDPKHQKHGVGSKLMDFAENESKLNGFFLNINKYLTFLCFIFQLMKRSRGYWRKMLFSINMGT